MNKKGFTLIELLVVISIIVVLASIVLVGVQNATQRAADARIISAVAQYRTQAEIYRSDNGSYLNLETAPSSTYPDIQRLFTDVTSQGSTYEVHSTANEYCIKSSLRAATGTYYCADARGNAGNTTNTAFCEASHEWCE